MTDQSLGEVAVQVSADLTRLNNDLAAAKKSVDKFDNDNSKKASAGQKKLAASTKELDRAANELTKKYHPLVAAMNQYEKELKQLDQLEKAGMITAKEAAATRILAAKSFMESKNKLESLNAGMSRAKKVSLALAAAAGVSLVISFSKFVAATLRANAELGRTADKIGITVEQFQVLKFGADQLGISQGELESGLEGLGKALAKASTGAEREKQVFDLLGVSIKDADGHVRSISDVLPDLSNALARVPDEAQRAAAEMILFGESGGQLDELLGQGSGKINELAEAAENLGIVLSDEQIQKSDETAKKLDQMQMVLSANIAGAVADNADSILSLVDSLTQLVIWAGKAGIAWRDFSLRMESFGNNIDLMNPLLSDDARSNILNRELEINQARFQAQGGVQKKPKAPYDMSGGAAGIFGDALKLANSKPIDLSSLNAPKPRKGRSGPSADTLARRAERERLKALRYQKSFDDEISAEKKNRLRLESDLTTDTAKLAELQRQMLGIDKERAAADLKFNGPEGARKYNAAQVEQLKLLDEQNFSLRGRLIDQQEIEAIAEDALKVAQAGLDNDNEILSLRSGLARTQAKRRAIELDILKNSIKIERNDLERVIASDQTTKAEKAIALARMAQLDQIAKLSAESIKQGTQGPLEAYLDSIPRTIEDINEAIQQIEADKLVDQGRRTIQFADDLSTAFGNAARSIINLENPLKVAEALLTDLAATFTEEFLIRPVTDFVRDKAAAPLAERLVGGSASPTGLTTEQINSQLTVTSSQLNLLAQATNQAMVAMNNLAVGGVAPLGTETLQASSDFRQLSPQMSQFGGALGQIMAQLGAGAGAGGGLLSTFLGIAASSFGGGITSGSTAALNPASNALIDSMPGIFATGGKINGVGTGTSDSNLIRASDGEFMINAEATKKHLPLLEAINADRLPGFKGGGLVGRIASAASGGGMAGRPLSFGDIIVPGASSEREGRKTARQVAGAIHREITRTSKVGMVE